MRGELDILQDWCYEAVSSVLTSRNWYFTVMIYSNLLQLIHFKIHLMTYYQEIFYIV